MTWKKINEKQRECGDYRISMNHCSASKDKFALSYRGKIIGQFARYEQALAEYERVNGGKAA